jgi:CheY-like chemotaxis protein
MARHLPARPLSVLVVDDDPDTATACADMLALKGFDTRVALSGAEALAAAPADVAVVDLFMPGVDGCELARRLRERPGRRPLLIAVSGCAADDTRRRATDAGFDLHVVKPVEPGVLRRFERLVAGPALSLV